MNLQTQYDQMKLNGFGVGAKLGEIPVDTEVVTVVAPYFEPAETVHNIIRLLSLFICMTCLCMYLVF